MENKTMIFDQPIAPLSALKKAISTAYRMDETIAVNNLISQATFQPESLERISKIAAELVTQTRERRKQLGGLDAFLKKYDLSSDEGIALMCLAEALLRIPDSATMDRLISDKISTAEWAAHLDANESLFINAATWSLMLTGKIFHPSLNQEKSLTAALKRFFSKAGETVIRPIILQGMKIIGKQFVMGTTIQEALERAKKEEAKGYRYSYDMLGEAAKTADDADHYFKSYQHAIEAIGGSSKNLGPIQSPGISVKLSALHPRYEMAKRDRVLNELAPRLLALAQSAKAYNIGLTVDAEEADRLELSLDVIEKVFSDPSLESWEGFGLAIQSYQKRAPFVIDWLADLSQRVGRKLMVRLVKGAYWDAEIKTTQVLGLSGYPVFTRKSSTDVSFIACAKKLLSHPECFYSQFGTHNAYSVAAILELASKANNNFFEFQCLHGMGAPLYDQVVTKGLPCRIYAPVGGHKDLLGYLVRRLLENGANTSFINRLADESAPIEKLIADPIERTKSLAHKPHPGIPLPIDLYQPQRKNSCGIDLSDNLTLQELKFSMDKTENQTWTANPIISGKNYTLTPAKQILSPSNMNQTIGFVHEATEDEVKNAITQAELATHSWGRLSIEDRALILERAAELFEKNKTNLMTLLCREGGKQIVDCLSEVRETIDFCYYYAAQARKELSPQELKSPTGEFNQLSLHPRGMIVCISPWNFPLAIFAGQILAALVTGNTVLAKPAEQTPLIAAATVRILHEAGVHPDALHLLPGNGEIVGAALVSDPRVDGVMFTGSTQTAQLINRTLANREGPIVPFIAETGGQNAMIVDSSALPEQVVADIISSSFNSAGQRCSALRVLFVQQDIAPRLLTMLSGTMAELQMGDPSRLSTDVGPIIDLEALETLQKHAAKMYEEAKLIFQVPLANNLTGHFFAPCVFEIKKLSELKKEVFGPILHVIRYSANELDQVLQQIIDTGYGLTLGIHSRINSTVQYIISRLPVGNRYVNRNMIGAVVGVQPFGGEHLSGTGPKAGGPYYLPRLCVERSTSINTTAAGGNASLVSLKEED